MARSRIIVSKNRFLRIFPIFIHLFFFLSPCYPVTRSVAWGVFNWFLSLEKIKIKKQNPPPPKNELTFDWRLLILMILFSADSITPPAELSPYKCIDDDSTLLVSCPRELLTRCSSSSRSGNESAQLIIVCVCYTWMCIPLYTVWHAVASPVPSFLTLYQRRRIIIWRFHTIIIIMQLLLLLLPLCLRRTLPRPFPNEWSCHLY